MDTSDWVSNVVAFLALFVSIVSIVVAKRANRIANRANRIAAGDSETAMLSELNAVWETIRSVHSDIADILDGRTKSQLKADEKRRLERKEKSARLACERLCHTYDAFCARYLDDSCNKERFRKSFNVQLRELVESDSEMLLDVLKPGPTTTYPAIYKVYGEWFNLEK